MVSKLMLRFMMVSLLTVLTISGDHFIAVASAETLISQDKSMANVQMMIKKLRDSMLSMKDLDALEDAGMDKADVDKMRRAMKQKIQQMTSDAVEVIRKL